MEKVTIISVILVLILLVLLGCTQFELKNSLPSCVPADINSGFLIAQSYVTNNVSNALVDYGSGNLMGSCDNESNQWIQFSVNSKDTNSLIGVIIVKNENLIEYKGLTFCNSSSDCDYRSFTGGCYNTEFVNQTLKDAQVNGMHIGEAPLIDGTVICTCEQNECVTSIVK